MKTDQLKFWNERAKLKHPGSDDWVAKELEVFAIMNNIKPKSTIIEFGCGDGSTLKRICKEKNCIGIGIDLSPEMIKKALKYKDNRTDFFVSDLYYKPNYQNMKFDYAITQRCIINFEPKDQVRAIENVLCNVKTDGYYIASENFADGLNRTNKLREKFKLKLMKQPIHNNYLKKIPVVSNGKVVENENILSLYHLISRVFVAKISKDKGKEPKYDNPLNIMAMKLIKDGYNFGDFGPNRLIIWKKI